VAQVIPWRVVSVLREIEAHALTRAAVSAAQIPLDDPSQREPPTDHPRDPLKLMHPHAERGDHLA
jgi:hypothetical protein